MLDDMMYQTVAVHMQELFPLSHHYYVFSQIQTRHVFDVILYTMYINNENHKFNAKSKLKITLYKNVLYA